MSNKGLSGLGALAAVDVLLSLATNLIAPAVGNFNAFAIAGTLFLAVSVSYGKAVLGDAPPPAVIANRGVGRRMFEALSVVVALALFAVSAFIANDEKPGTGDMSKTSSPAPAPLNLSQYFQQWRNGPVKIAVEHYNTWVFRATEKNDVDRTVVDLRVAIRNESSSTLDLSVAPKSLVLIMNAKFAGSKYVVDQKRIGEVPAEWQLYTVGFGNEGRVVQLGDEVHPIKWTAGQLGVGEEFSSSSPAHNGIAYNAPPPAAKLATETDAVTPRSAHVLGLGWLGPDGSVLGYTQVDQWAGPNTIASFLHA